MTPKRPAALLLTAALLLSAPLAQAQDASSPQISSNTLNVTLPARVAAVQFSVPVTVFPVENGAAPSLTVAGKSIGAVTRDGRHYWTVTGPDMTLSVTLPAGLAQADLSITVRYETGHTEPFQGTVPFKVLPAVTTQAAVTREGLILGPDSGPVARGRSSTNITTSTAADAPYQMTVNGEAVSERLVGRRTDDPDNNRVIREYIAVPLREGVNVVRVQSGAQTDEIRLVVAGAARTARVTPVEAVADGYTPVRLTLDVVDAQGNPTLLPYVTVVHPGTLIPARPDADPSQAGYQVDTRSGTATLAFQPVGTPTQTTLRLDVNGNEVNVPVTVAPAQKRNVVAIGSGTVSGLGGGEPLTTGAFQATVEAPIEGGQLTLHADSKGAHTSTPDLVRNPTLGDSSPEGRPMEADGPIAARYDHQAFSVQYARNAAQDPVFSQPDQGDALNFTTTGQTRVSAYYAPYALATLEEALPLNGTRVTRLPQGFDPAVTHLHLEVTEDGITKETELVRGRDYVIDEAGVVTLTRPVITNPEPGVTVRLLARTQNTGDVYAPGAQVAVTHDFATGEVQHSLSAGVHWDADATTFGVRYLASDRTGPVTFSSDALVAATMGGYRAQLTAAGKAGATTWTATATSQSEDFDGKAQSAPGSTLNVSVSQPITAQFGVRGTLRASSDAAGLGARAGLDLTYTPASNQQYAAGLFAGTGTLGGFGVNASAQWTQGPWTNSLTGTYNFTDEQGRFTASTLRRIPLPATLPPNTEFSVGAKATATVRAGEWSFTSAAVLQGRSGPYTASLEYALPTVSGQNGELRAGVQATFPVTPNLNVGASLAVTPTTQTVTADARYRDPLTTASLGADLAHDETLGVNGSVRFSAARTLTNATTGTVTPLGITADGLSTFGDQGTGHRYSLGLTYRGERFSAAGYARYRAGILTATRTGSELTGELNGTYHLPNSQLRLGLAAQSRSGDDQGLTLQAVAAYRHWLTDSFAVGAAYRGLYVPALNQTAHALGFEATYRLYSAAALSAGYNLGGFTGLTAEPTRAGLYLRLDFLVDDSLAARPTDLQENPQR